MCKQIKPKIAMIILAAGESKRMDAIKQLLPWKNTTLLGYTIEQGLVSDVDSVFVILGANSKSILNKIDQTDIVIINNQNWQKGMGTSIACAMHYFEKESLKFAAVLITLIDQPLLDAKHYNKLIYSYIKTYKNIISTKIKSKTGVPAIIDYKYFEELSMLDQNFGAKKVIAANLQDVYSINSYSLNVDIDTKETYDSLFGIYGS